MTPSGNGDEPLKSMVAWFERTSSGRWGGGKLLDMGFREWNACQNMHAVRRGLKMQRE
jgi:hypothetical protein